MASYASISDLRQQIDKQQNEAGKPSSAANLQLLLDAASEMIDGYCNRPDGFLASGTATARTFSGSGEQWQRIDECAAITGVEVKDSPTADTYTAWSASDWIPFAGTPQNPNFNVVSQRDPRPYTHIMVAAGGAYSLFTCGSPFSTLSDNPYSISQLASIPTVRVTANWGFALTVPSRVRQACLTQATIWLKRGEGSWSDTLASTELGRMLYTQQLDPAVMALLKLGRLIRVSI